MQPHAEPDEKLVAAPVQVVWWRRRWVGLLPWVLILFALAYRDAPLRKPRGPAGGILPVLDFVTLDGAIIPTSQLKGKAVIVNFWAPWCGPCRQEVPWFEQMQQANKGKVVVLGVLADHGVDYQASEFMRAQSATYPVIRESPEIDARFGGVSVLPTTFYVDRSGHIVHSVAGAIPDSLMRRYLEDALK